MRHVVLFLVVVSLALHSCESDETRMKKMADEYCECFSAVNDKVSVETAEAWDMRASKDGLEKVLAKIDTALWPKIVSEYLSMEATMDDPSLKPCKERFEKKLVEGNKIDIATISKLVPLMETRNECRVATLFMRMMFVVGLKPE
jgi:hypothetical protein